MIRDFFNYEWSPVELGESFEVHGKLTPKYRANVLQMSDNSPSAPKKSELLEIHVIENLC